MAGWTGLEPAAFRVTGGRYNQLNYHPAVIIVQERTFIAIPWSRSNLKFKQNAGLPYLCLSLRQIAKILSFSKE